MGSKYGKILSPIPSPIQAEYFVKHAPFQFIAADSIDADSVIVRIRAGVMEEISFLSKMTQSHASYSLAAMHSGGSEAGGRQVARINDIPESEFESSDFDVGDLVVKKDSLKVTILDHTPRTIWPQVTTAKQG